MARPSIFSKEYERHKRRRRRMITLSVVFILAAAGIILASASFKEKIVSKVSEYKNIKLFTAFQKEKKNDTAQSDADKKTAEEAQTTAPPAEKQEEETGYEVALSDGTKIKAVLIPTDSGEKFKYVLPMDARISFSINPSGTAMVIMDSAAQTMLLVDVNGGVQDITNQSYKYSDGVIRKDSTLARLKQQNYVWCASPKFIDDEHVAYLSQLPQARSTVSTKYCWYVNIKNKDVHTQIPALKGESIKLGNTTEKGLEAILDDGTSKFIKTSDGDLNISE